MAKAEEFEIVEIVQEDPSSEDNDGLLHILNTIKAGETLLVLTLSLLSPSLMELLELIGDLDIRGCRLISIHESLDSKIPHGKFMITMLGAITELQTAMDLQGSARDRITIPSIYPAEKGPQ